MKTNYLHSNRKAFFTRMWIFGFIWRQNCNFFFFKSIASKWKLLASNLSAEVRDVILCLRHNESKICPKFWVLRNSRNSLWNSLFFYVIFASRERILVLRFVNPRLKNSTAVTMKTKEFHGEFKSRPPWIRFWFYWKKYRIP